MRNSKSRPAFKRITIQSLFAKSGNRCAFENCQHELVTEENLFVGQICHIEGFSANGPRFNASLGLKSREFENLILLCYKHHKMIDSNPTIYNIEFLKNLKKTHEAQILSSFFADDYLIKQVEIQEKNFWREVENINKNEHPHPAMALEINAQATADDLFSDLKNFISEIENLAEELSKSDSNLPSELEKFIKKGYKKNKYWENYFIQRNWEWHNLAIPNTIIRTRLTILQLNIKYLELYLKKYPKDILAQTKFIQLKKEIKEWANSCVHD